MLNRHTWLQVFISLATLEDIGERVAAGAATNLILYIVIPKINYDSRTREIDIELKKISIESVKTSRRLGIYALAIALVTGSVPIIISLTKEEPSSQLNIEPKVVSRFLEEQEYNRKQQKSFQDSILILLKKP